MNYCKSRDIKDKFYPTIIAIDFIEKESGVFLCYKDKDRSGAKCYFPSEEKGFFQKFMNTFLNTIQPILMKNCKYIPMIDKT